MNGADLIVHKLREHGIEWLTTLCGNGLDPLFRVARDGGIGL